MRYERVAACPANRAGALLSEWGALLPKSRVVGIEVGAQGVDVGPTA